MTDGCRELVCLAAGSRTLRFVDARTGAERAAVGPVLDTAVVDPHADRPTVLGFGAEPDVVRAWDAATGRPVAAYRLPEPVPAAGRWEGFLSADGRTVVVGVGGNLYVFRRPP